VTGRPFGSDQDALRSALAEQITRPVRWTDCVRHLRDAGVTEFVELGGTKVLTSLVDKITAAEPLVRGPGSTTTGPADGGPWLDYRDERVLALLRDCASGTLGVDEAIAAISAGGPGRR
jgi:acyl transferase domain-containing protein